MKTNDILNMAKTYGLPFEIEEWGGVNHISVTNASGQPYFEFKEVDGRICVMTCFGIKGKHGYVDDETIVNMIKELAA
jgi:hypothetical protein